MLLRRRIVLASFILVASLTTNSTYLRASSIAERVDSVARSFRVQTYEKYRDNRREYDRRIAAADNALQAWKRDTENDNAASVVAWFQAAGATPAGQPLPAYASSQPSTRPRVDRGATRINRPVEPSRSAPRPGNRRATERLSVGVVIAPEHFDRTDNLLPLAPQRSTSEFGDAFDSVRFPRQDEQQLDDVSVMTAQIRPAPAIEVRPTSVASDGFDDSPPVDLSLLAAKIRSTNLSLQGLESELRIERLWSLSELEAVADLLSQRIGDRELANTYLSAVPRKYLGQIEPLIGIKPILALLAQRTFELQIDLTGLRAPGHQDLARVSQITERIQLWSEQQQD